MRIIVAITAASGAIYARLLLEALLRSDAVEQIALIYSRDARRVVEFERQQMPDDERVTTFDNGDMFAAPASGSADYDAMVIIPSSVGTVGRIASGVSDSLICRAADVMLKERRRLVVVVREAPLSLIHLRNLTTLAECGAVIIPASPSFYSHPESIEALCSTIIERIMVQIGVSQEHYRWK